jgi:hypothetical protein
MAGRARRPFRQRDGRLDAARDTAPLCRRDQRAVDAGVALRHRPLTVDGGSGCNAARFPGGAAPWRLADHARRRDARGRADAVLLGEPPHPRHQRRDPLVLYLSGPDARARPALLQAADSPARAVGRRRDPHRRGACYAAGGDKRQPRPAWALVAFTVTGDLRLLSRRERGAAAPSPAGGRRRFSLSRPRHRVFGRRQCSRHRGADDGPRLAADRLYRPGARRADGDAVFLQRAETRALELRDHRQYGVAHRRCDRRVVARRGGDPGARARRCADHRRDFDARAIAREGPTPLPARGEREKSPGPAARPLSPFTGRGTG